MDTIELLTWSWCNLHWKVVPILEVPEEEKKPGIHMGKETQKMHWYGKVQKYKAIQKAHGGQRVHSIN